MSKTFTEALKDVLAFTPKAFAALGTHLKPEWFFEALAAHQNPEAQRRCAAGNFHWIERCG